LILGAGPDILPGQDGQKPFQFMFTWHKQRQAFEEVAISTGAREGIEIGNDCKVFALHNFRKPPHWFGSIIWPL
jgi:hypothetical protein